MAGNLASVLGCIVFVGELTPEGAAFGPALFVQFEFSPCSRLACPEAFQPVDKPDTTTCVYCVSINSSETNAPMVIGGLPSKSIRQMQRGDPDMATGLYVMPDGSVMVDYGPRRLPISCAQYRANGYKPVLEKLVVKSCSAKVFNASGTLRTSQTSRPAIGGAAALHLR